MKRLNTFIALIIAAVVVVNSNMFRTDVQANPLVVAGYAVSAAAVSAIAAALTAGGIQVTTQADVEDFTYDFFNSIITPDKTSSQIEDELSEIGFVVDSESMTIGVQDSSRVSVKYDPVTGTFSDLTYNTVVETGKLAADGAIMIGGIVQTIDKVTSLGEALYDYLHAGDFTYNPGFNADIGSFEDIRMNYYKLQQDLAASNYSYIFDIDTRDPDYYSLPYRVSQYEYYDIYSFIKPVDTGNYLEEYTVLFFACLCYNSDGDYVVFCNYIHHGTNYGTDISHSQSFQVLSGSDYTVCYDDKINFGFNRNRLYYSLSQMQQVAHYVNTDVVSDTGVLDTPATDTITDGEHTFPVDKSKEGTTVWDIPTAIPDVIKNNGAVDENDKTILPFPAIGTDGVLDFPVDYPLNPDLDLNPALPDTVLEGDNIFDLLAEFFRNFWKLLSQNFLDVLKAFLGLLAGFFASCFVPPAGYIEGKINELRLTFCPVLPAIDIDSKEIPDITWSIGDSTVGSSSGVQEIVIVNNSFLRNNIDTFRSIICGFIWFMFLINKLFALLRYLNIVQVPSVSDSKGGP